MNDAAVWLRSRSRPVRRLLALTVGFGEAAGILLIVQTALLVRIGNEVIFHHTNLSPLTVPFVALIAVVVVRAGVVWAARRSGAACASSVKHTIRAELVGRLSLAGPLTLSGEHGGEVANTVVDAVQALDGYYARYLPQRAIAALLPLTVLAVVFPLDWLSGITLLVTAVFIPIMMIFIGEDAHARNQRLWGTFSRMSARFLDTLQGITTLKLFGAERREVELIGRISEEYRRSTMSVMQIAFVSALMLELISTVSIAIVAIASGLRMLAGHMSFAPGYLILLIAPEYFLTLRNLGTFYHSRMEAVSAADHITRLLSLGEPALEEPGGLDGAARPGESGQPGQSAPSSPPAVEFTEVSLRYSADRETVLHEVSFAVAPGEHCVLLGPSGVGKSTLITLLLGFVSPSSGQVAVGGQLLPYTERERALRAIAWLPQRPTVFHGTVAENIAFGRAGSSREEVEGAARAAFADEFIRRLPEGYETFLGERGRGLSGGQIQRLALARLFLRDAPLVLLDEPTAHLDEASEELVRTAISGLIRGRTSILVTHRLPAARSADLVVVLEQGRVVEQGRPELLAAQQGRYAELLALGGEGLE